MRIQITSASRKEQRADEVPAAVYAITLDEGWGPRTDVDGTLFHAGALGFLVVPAYARADARVEVTLTRQLSAVAAGKNLFDAAQAEYASKVLVATRVPRSVSLQLVARDGT
jgi:hypothetical protein